MSLMFEGGNPHNESALLSFANPVIKPLDQFEKNVIVRTPNKYSNEYDYWLFADFPVSYDPCTCLFTSQLTFTVQLIQTTNASLTLKLTGSSTGTVKQIISASPGGVESGAFSNSALNWVNGVVQSGNEGYKSWTSFRDAGMGFLNFLTDKSSGEKTSFTSQLGDLQNFFKQIPYIGGVLGVFDFLTGGGKKSATQAGPTAMQVNLKHDITGTADGKLQLSTVRGYRTINTPGSQIAGSGSGMPTYDNILGVFSLLETPKIEYLEYGRAANQGTSCESPNPYFDPNCQSTPDDPYLCDYNYPTISSGAALYETKIRQYKLTAPLKYAINPAANMDLIDIKAALVIYDSTIGVGFNHAASFGDVQLYSSYSQKLNNMGYEYETNQKYRTAFVPLSCISNTSIMDCLGSSVAYPVRNPSDVYLKIQATFRRQDATATTQDVIFAATYKTSITRSVLDPGNLTFFIVPTGRTGTDGLSLQPCEYGNTYYYTPSQNIFPNPIAGIAGVTSPTYPTNCLAPMPPQQTITEITSFCNNPSLYNHLATGSVAKVDMDRSLNIPNMQLENKIDLLNSPNPFKNETTITFNLIKKGNVKLIILDQNGRVMQVLIDKILTPGKYNINYQTKLSSGLYYCTMQTENFSINKKIIIIK